MYNPKHGERVIFRINPDGIDLYGTAVSESASNMALIQEDVEDGQIWAVPASQIQPDDEADATPSFWEAAKTFCRTARVSCDLANALQAQIDAFPLSTGSLIGDKVAARIAEHRERAEKAEADRDRFRSDLYEEMSRSGKLSADLADALDKVEILKYTSSIPDASAAEYRERAEKAEADLAQCRKALHDAIAEAAKVEKARDAAEARIEELEDQNRQLKSVLDTTNEDVRNARLRAGKHAAELGEIKAALRTLAGER